MGSKSSSPPPAPDPAKTAAAQGAANLETAIAQGYLNAANVTSPFGNVTYDTTGTVKVGDKDVPRFEQNIELNPEQQRQLDLQNSLRERALQLGGGVLENVGSATDSPFNLNGLPQAPGMDDFSADRDKVTQAIIARNQPMMDRNRDRLANQLANQGLSIGSEAYGAAMDDLGRSENDFNLAAIERGGAEQSRLFGLGQAARQQGIQERTLERSQPINEYATLLGLGGNVQTPQFGQFNPGNIAPTDIAGPMNLQYGNQMAGWQANQQANQATMGGLFGLAGAGLGAGLMPGGFLVSDRRMKTAIRRVGATDGGLPVYTFRYKSGGPVQMGVMAQDVEKVMPWAVAEIAGLKAVDYAEIR